MSAKSLNYLPFEQPIYDLQKKISELRLVESEKDIDISEEIAKLELKSKQITKEIFSDLTVSQIVLLARHPNRPYAFDYINRIFTDFDELHGDRRSGKGETIIGGIARLNGRPVMIIGHQKGRKTSEKIARNFGMPQPGDYRKALRLMEMAEKFNMPILTFIDTPGAYPGIQAEEHNQSEAIARNLLVMSRLKTPIICTVTGEGGSGGALAIAVGDCLMMMQYSIYSVISPEGCASILWRSAEKASEAAEALGITADRILSLGLIDKIIEEPLGGAHRNPDEMAAKLKLILAEKVEKLCDKSINQLVDERYARIMSYGLM